MRAVTAVLGIVLAGYLALCALMAVRQTHLVYFPQATRIPADQTDFALPRGDVTLRGWVLSPETERPILYFGGNAEQVGHTRAQLAQLFPDRPVYLLAYRGYGASDGAPREADLHADALALYDHVSARHPGQPIAVIGRSLGSGVASRLAASRPVERLALITPFDSLVAVGQGHYPWLPVRWLLRERYRSDQALAAYTAPVLILRAGQDRVVPPERTDQLLAALPRAPIVVEIPRAGHDTLSSDPAYARALRDFMQSAASQ